MKKIILMALLVLAACNYDSNTLTSGNTLNNPMNGDSGVTLTTRVNKDVLDGTISLSFLNELKGWSEERIPGSWPEVSVPKLREVFLFLNTRDMDRLITDVSVETLGNGSRLTFDYKDAADFALDVDKQITNLSWESERGQAISMIRSGSGWVIQSEGEVLQWSPAERRLCYTSECVDL